MTTNTEALENELREIDAEIMAAAVNEDAVAFLELSMHRAALPSLIAQEKARPVQLEIERLTEELSDLEAEAKRVESSPAPEVPPHQRHFITQNMMKNRRLQSIGETRLRVGRELKAAEARLAETLLPEQS